MCGIAGVLGRAFLPSREELCRIANSLTHRGPDDLGIWSDSEVGVHLMHRRLSIVDLSAAGHQPMVSECGRFVLVLNGEIYNHLVLRRQIDKDTPGGVGWRGHSDTETLLNAFVIWGVEKTLRATTGMFALALWDIPGRRLILARDRLGEKPLYFGMVGSSLVFASELKAIKAFPGFHAPVAPAAVALFMRYSYVPETSSIYEGIQKLPPGKWLEFTLTDGVAKPLREAVSFWSAAEAAVSGGLSPHIFTSDDHAISALEERLQNVVADQMIADVSLGAFLSGGVDSSTVVAMMQAHARKAGASPVRTFSIGFHNPSYDEAPFAREIARQLGTIHTETYVSDKDAMDVIPKLPLMYDEPFADSSQLPTSLVSQMARGQVTVALSGDGGDELFGGYNRYVLAGGMWGKIERIPAWLRAAGGRFVQSFSVAALNRAYGYVRSALPSRLHLQLPGEKLHKAARMLGAASAYDLYFGLVSQWDPKEIMRSPITEPGVKQSFTALLPSAAECMMLEDMVTYLPGDILAKVDRAAMAASLETRAPYLDHALIEFAWQLPLKYKIRDGQGKWLLRQVLFRHVPQSLLARPKMGFGVPIDAWLRGPLREWAENLLAPSRVEQDGWFNSQLIQRKWREHLSGVANWQHQLWAVLMFNAWLDENKAG